MENHASMLERIFMLDVHEDSYKIDQIMGEIPEYIRVLYMAT
jgi:hypothetical protein